MKSFLRSALALGLLFAGTAFADAELAGDWRGKLPIDASTSLPIQFVFSKKADGSYSAVLNSLENDSIRNVSASAVTWKAGALKVEVPALSGSYAGTLKDDHFEGQWSQAGSSAIALALSRAQKASKADVDALSGTWHGPVPGAPLTFVFEFKADAKGDLTGALSVPEQGGQRIPMANLEVGGGNLSFKLLPVSGEYKGTYTGGTITGLYKQNGQPPNGAPVNLTKGEFAAQSHPLKLSTEAFAALSGTWHGKVGPINSALRFAANTAGQLVAFLDAIDQKAMNIPITEVTVTGQKVVLKVPGVGGEFSGDLAGKTLTGQWTQAGRATPVTWTKQ